ncbi:MAG: acyl-ACP--UDP-N-acetylglucosamine O-acyltransferase [Planctomycetota bacterium]|nr:acyl-ACP--UDP-N-acetylglucosamine O-acyltransferase [Planctomycetota bacterium]
MSRIHPTAVIDPAARLHDDVEVGAYCVIDGPVELGAGTRLMPHVTVLGHVAMGSGNTLHPGCVLGSPPQDLKYRGEPTRIVIGDGNHFREHVTVHPGTATGGGITRVGSGGLFMVGAHIAHDCVVGDHVVLANHVLLAGHVRIGDRAILNGASALHHFTSVGRLAYVGGLTRVTQDVHPFTIVEGHPARIRACNTIGMQRSGAAAADVDIIKQAIFSILISDRRPAQVALAEVEARYPDHPLVAELLGSIRAAGEGRQGRAAEGRRVVPRNS